MSKRDHISAIADDLLYNEGFVSVGIDRIVDEAGVALGTLYNHFGSRSGVIIGAMQHREHAYFDCLREAAVDKSGDELVLSLFDGLCTWAQKQGGNGCFFLRAAADHPSNQDIIDEALAHKRRFMALVDQRVRESGQSDARSRELTPALYVLFEGAVASFPLLGFDIATQEARNAAQKLLTIGGE